MEFLFGQPGLRTPVDIREVDIPLANLPAALNGLRLAVLSDLHYGRYIWDEFTRKLVDLTNAQKPDIVLIPGDIVNRRPRLLEPCTALLAQLRAPLGVFACLGNHDWYAGPRQVAASMRAAGINMLVNSHRRLEHNGAGIILAGIDDLTQGKPDLQATFRGAGNDAPVILMSHNPDQAEMLDGSQRVDLVVCGHTHGGQIAPFGRALVTRIRHKKYLQGLIRGPHGWVYTSRGVGMVGLPLRWDCRPEIPVLRLVAETKA